MNKNPYLELFPIDGRYVEADGNIWRADVTNVPDSVNTDRVCYDLEFRRLQGTHGDAVRRLRLWTSAAGLHVERHGELLMGVVRDWLLGLHPNGEVEALFK
jgi:hypothetical protein